jgi:hypothetical protein
MKNSQGGRPEHLDCLRRRRQCARRYANRRTRQCQQSNEAEATAGQIATSSNIADVTASAAGSELLLSLSINFWYSGSDLTFPR